MDSTANEQAIEHVLVLSAPGAPELAQYAAALADRLDDLGLSDDTVAAAAYTLQIGRTPLTHRAVVTSEVDDVLAALRSIASGGEHAAVRVAVVEPTGANDVTGADEAVDAWLAGADVDWAALWDGRRRRLSLPSAPSRTSTSPRAALDSAPESDAQRGRSDATGAIAAAEHYLIELYADVSGLAVDRVGARTPLQQLGVSSFLVTQLNGRLQQDLGERDRTLFFTHPDLAGVAGDLVQRHPDRWGTDAAPRAASDSDAGTDRLRGKAAGSPRRESGADAGTDRQRGKAPTTDEDGAVAIVGMAARFPNSPTIADFWQTLADGVDCIRPMPADRAQPDWPTDTMWGGYLDDVESFDPLLFSITPRDAELMDPQERLFLEIVWEGLEDAGYTRARLRDRHDSQVAVYVGAMHNEYPYFGVERSGGDVRQDSGATLGGIANRVSFFLDLHGPSLSVDTMCSSSLTALHLARHSLLRGEAQVAIVGATNLSLHANKFVQQNRMQLAATDHHCRSFGKGGDGFVPAEGAAALILKPLAQARADGDRIHAVVTGSAVVHAGRTNGYLVPNPVAQGDMVSRAWQDAGRDLVSAGYLETHGAGTALGDPVEIAGLLRAMGDRPENPIPIGSVKSVIGHAESAAGLAGLIKVVLQMQHGEYVPTQHTDELNPEIEWDEVPFHVQNRRAPWPRPDGDARRAGISSFGAGGTIAHVVVEEAPDAGPASSAAGPQLIVLSGRDEPALRRVCERLVDTLPDADEPGDDSALAGRLRSIRDGALSDELGADAAVAQRLAALLLGDAPAPEAPALGDLAWTLQIGREPLRERLAVVADSVADLAASLRAYLAGAADGYVRGTAGLHRESSSGAGSGAATRGKAWTAEADRADLHDLARWWADGGDVDWTGAGERVPGTLVDLPHYPFDRMRCWLPDAGPASVGARSAASNMAPDDKAHDRSAPAPSVPLYERSWVEDGPVSTEVSVPAGRVVVVHSPHSEPIARAIAALVEDVVLVREGGVGSDGGYGLVTAEDAGSVAEALRDTAPVAGWLDLADLHRPSAELGLWQARLALLQGYLAGRNGAQCRVLHAVSGLQDLAGGATPNTAGAPFAGFVRVLAAEDAVAAIRVLDLDVIDPGAAAHAILAELATESDVPDVCHRAGSRHRAALVAVSDATEPFTARADATYLVTGGTGGLGALVARRLVDRGARRLAVFGHNALDDEREARVQALRDAGADVLVHTGSLADRTALAVFLDRVRDELGPIAGVVHCAGRGATPVAFAAKELAQIATVFEPKLDGLQSLAQALADDHLDIAVGFSSICAVAPTVARGVSDYAAANGCIDAAAGAGLELGGCTLQAVSWPQWHESGGGVGADNPCAHLGIGTLSDVAGLAALEALLARPQLRRAVVLPPSDGSVDLDAVLAARRATITQPHPAAAPAAEPKAEAAVESPRAAASEPEAATAAGEPEAATGALPPDGPPDWLVDIFATALHLSADRLDPTTDFNDLGVESIMLGELLQEIEQHVDQKLDPGLLLDFPTLAQLTDALADELGDAFDGGVPVGPPPASPAATDPVRTEPESAPQPAAPSPAPKTSKSSAPPMAHAIGDQRVVIVGAACRFPGAPDLDTFWQNLLAGTNSVVEVPASRWDHREIYSEERELGHSISKWGGFVDGIEDFDPDAFGIAEDEARALDPAIRLTLETTAAGLADAGYRPDEVAGGEVGVFVGARMSDYGSRVGVRQGVLRSDQNFITAYVAQHFDLRGPNLVVDSACSSSLVSVQIAMRSLLAGECTMAVAGGVEILLDEADYIDLSASGALSPSGRCATFDEAADGFVPGEGCGVVVLKPLSAALADGDRIHAVLDAVAVNNDGRTMGVTTPSHGAQQRVVRRAIEVSGRSTDEFGLIEAHGTGTMIGDPIELRGLTEIFAEGRAPASCPIGSVKSNIGHLMSAAGIAGVLKAMLAIEHGTVPATLWCENPNPRFDFASSPFFPNVDKREWDRPAGSRVAGVSSFGLGGTNAHAVLSDVVRDTPATREPLPLPRYDRRRLWFDRADAPASAPQSNGADASASARKPRAEPLSSSLLDLELVGGSR